jgi:hypothetical protein
MRLTFLKNTSVVDGGTVTVQTSLIEKERDARRFLQDHSVSGSRDVSIGSE